MPKEKASVEFKTIIPYHMQPFRPDYRFYPADPTFFSNGKKALMAAEVGIRSYSFGELADAMEVAEKGCHGKYRRHAIGRYQVDGVPYPLITTEAKGKAAQEVLWNSGMRSGIGIVSDAVISFVKNGRSFAVTAHKIKSEEDKAVLMETLYSASLAEDVEVITMSGLYRFDLSRPDLAGEHYLVEVNHGTVAVADMAVLNNKIVIDDPKSGSLDIPFILDHVTRHGHNLPVSIKKYEKKQQLLRLGLLVPDERGRFQEKQIQSHMPEELIEPDHEVYFEIPAYQKNLAHLMGVGFVTS